MIQTCRRTCGLNRSTGDLAGCGKSRDLEKTGAKEALH
jgi:hypothetical protein